MSQSAKFEEVYAEIVELKNTINIREAEKAALINGQETLQRQIAEKNSEIERYKGVIKLLEKDVKDTTSEAVKSFAHLLIDTAKNGIIYAMDIADYVFEMLHKSDGAKVGYKEGEWLEKLDKLDSKGYIYYECSNCNSLHKYNTKFCPDCGQIMKKEN